MVKDEEQWRIRNSEVWRTMKDEGKWRTRNCEGWGIVKAEEQWRMQNSEGRSNEGWGKNSKGREKMKNNKVWGTVTDKEEVQSCSSFTGTRPFWFLIVLFSLSFNVTHSLVPRPSHWSSSLTTSFFSFSVTNPPPFFLYQSFSSITVLCPLMSYVLRCFISSTASRSPQFISLHCSYLSLFLVL